MADNSTAAIKKRLTAGKITWTGVLIMLTARSVLAVICQALGAAIFYKGSINAWGGPPGNKRGSGGRCTVL